MVADLDQIERWSDLLDQYSDELRAAIAAALLHLTAGRKDIVSIGLMSDSDASSLIPAAETAAHLLANQQSDPDLADWYECGSDEWEIQIGNDPTPMDPVMAKLAPLAETVPDDDFIEYTTTVWTWVVDVMAELVAAGWFAEHYPDAVVVFSVTDFDMPDETTIEELEQLNPNGRADRFISWLLANPSD